MTSANPGAVFFLGTKAHYQALQPPDSMVDIDNGNDGDSGGLVECGWTHCARSERSGSDMLLMEYRCEDPGLSTMGVTRRFRGKRTQDGSNERILSDENSECIDPVGLQNLPNRDVNKNFSTRCAPLRALLSGLRPRRRKPSEDCDRQMPLCTFRDSCRCVDCQARYFECDDSDSDCSMPSDYDYNVIYDVYDARELDGCEDTPDQSPDLSDNQEDDDEVFVDAAVHTLSTDQLIKAPETKISASSEEYEEQIDLEMAAGTPVVLDYLLNHPIACTIM